MNSHRCSNCDFLNFSKDSACKRCGLSFDSSVETEAGTDWNPQPTASQETYPQPSEGGSFYWDQPQPQPSYQSNYYAPSHTVASSGNAKIVRILILVAVLVVVAVGAIPMLLKGGKSEFSNLSWYEYQSPDKKFSVSLPVTPKTYERTIPSPFGNAQAQAVEAAVGKEGGCMLIAADYPVVNSKISEAAIYDMAIQGATRTNRVLGMGQRKDIMLFGHKGVEVQLLSKDPERSFIGSARIFWVSPRLYVMATGGPDTPEFRAVHTRCLESFRIQ